MRRYRAPKCNPLTEKLRIKARAEGHRGWNWVVSKYGLKHCVRLHGCKENFIKHYIRRYREILKTRAMIRTGVI